MCHMGLGKLTFDQNAPINDYYLTTASNKISEYLTIGLPVLLPNTTLNQTFYHDKEYVLLTDSTKPEIMARDITEYFHAHPNTVPVNRQRVSEYFYDNQFQKILDIIDGKK